MKFQQREILIAVVAFLLGVGLTLLVSRFRIRVWKEGMTGNTIPGVLHANGSYRLQFVLGQIQRYDKRFNPMVVTVKNAPSRVMAVKVIKGYSTAKTQIETTGQETTYQRIYSFPTKSWVSLKTQPVREGAGYIVEALQPGIEYELGNGDKFVLIGLK